MSETKKKWLKYAIGFAFTLVAIWLTFRKLDMAALKLSLSRMNVFWVAASITSTLLSVYVLGFRWHILLKPKIHLSKFYLFKLNIICQYLNIIIPGRFGEFAKSWIPAKEHRVSGSYVLGTVLIERMFDFFTWVMIWLSFPAFFVFKDKIATEGYELFLGVSLGLIGFLVLVIWKKEWVQKCIHFFSKVLPSGFRQKLLSFLDRGMEAFGLLKSFRTMFILVLYTVLIIFLSSFNNYLLFKAFPFTSRLSLFEAMILMTVNWAGNAPPSVPGKVGIFEYFVILGLGLFGIGHNDALCYGLMLHIVSFLPKIILGFIFMSGLKLTIKKAETEFEKFSDETTINQVNQA